MDLAPLRSNIAMEDDETVRKPVHAMRLDQFDLATRTTNCFEQANITTVGQLARLTSADIRALPNCGPKTVAEIEAILESVGLGLAVEAHREAAASIQSESNLADEEKIKQRVLIGKIELDRFNPSTRTANCLVNQEITNIDDLVLLTPLDVLKWPNAGQKTLHEVRLILGSVGLSLRNDDEPIIRIDHGKLARLLLPRGAEQLTPFEVELKLSDAAPDVLVSLLSKLETFPLSVRALNVVSEARIQYLGELAQLKKQDLRKMRNCGACTVNELTALLESEGLSLGLRISDWSRKRVSELATSISSEIARKARERSTDLLAKHGSEPTGLEEELRRLVESFEKGRNVALLLKLWGWDGSGPRVLESVGGEFGLTRERVRQIAARAIKRLKRHKFDTPHLNSAIVKLRRQVPALDNTLADWLRSQGITRNRFNIWGLGVAADLLGVQWGLTHIAVNGASFVVSASDQAKLAKIFVVLRRKTSELGCVNIQSLCSEIEIEETRANVVRQFLEVSQAVDWLDEDKEWMYLRNVARNRLFNLCEKVLSVCPSIGIGELRRAVSRSRRLAMAPPQTVLASFVERERLGTIQGSRITATSSQTVVSPESAEGKMLRVLDEFGPIMDGEEMAERCIAAGMNATTFYIYRLVSPIVSALGKGVYCRVGSEVPLGAVEDIVSRRRAIMRVSDHGWTPKGSLWFGVELSRMIMTAGSIRLLSFVSDLVQGEWSVKLPDGGTYGTVTCRDSFIWTFRKQLKVLGAEPGDLMVLEFDIRARTVLVRVGGPGLFETVQEAEADVETLEALNNLDDDSEKSQMLR